MANISSKSKKRLLERDTGYSKCIYKTRQIPWFQMEGRGILYQEVMGRTSDLLQEILSQLDGPERAHLVHLRDRLCTHIAEELQDKYDKAATAR